MSQELRRKIEARRRIYLVRHGEVSYFDATGRPHPHRSVPLNEDGRKQALEARDALARVPIDRAVCTGLPRTQETAQIILAGRDLRPETLTALQEVSPGPFAKESLGSAFEAFFTNAFAGSASRESQFLGGESFGAFQDRVIPAFQALLADPAWKHLLLVAHGGTNRLLLLYALGADLTALGALEQDAGCINVIDVHEENRLVIRQMNLSPRRALELSPWTTTLEKIYLDHYEQAARAIESGAANGPRRTS